MKPPETPSTESKTEEFGPRPVVDLEHGGVHNYLWCNSVKRASRCRGRIIRQSILFLGDCMEYGSVQVLWPGLCGRPVIGHHRGVIVLFDWERSQKFQEGMGWMPCWIIQFMRSAVSRQNVCPKYWGVGERKTTNWKISGPGSWTLGEPLRLCRCSAG